MSVYYYMKEKITINNTAAVPAGTLETIVQEITRIRRHQNRQERFLKVSVNTRSGWSELTGRKVSSRSLLSILLNNRSVVISLNFKYSYIPKDSDIQEPGFFLKETLENADDSLFDVLSYEFYNIDKFSEGNGILFQMYKNPDGTIFKGEPDYEEISEVPDAFWQNYPETVFVLPTEFKSEHDLDAINAATNKLNALEYIPLETPYDFHNPDEEACIFQPKFETKAQRAEFCEALEELRIATNGEFCLGFDNSVEWDDESTTEVRRLKMTIDLGTGEIKFFMTKPLPVL